MNKDKKLIIRIPSHVFLEFKNKCDANYKSMSDTIRDFIREYLKNEEINVEKFRQR